jgi:hypothetical protein
MFCFNRYSAKQLINLWHICVCVCVRERERVMTDIESNFWWVHANILNDIYFIMRIILTKCNIVQQHKNIQYMRYTCLSTVHTSVQIVCYQCKSCDSKSCLLLLLRRWCFQAWLQKKIPYIRFMQSTHRYYYTWGKSADLVRSH